jgi:mercuric ion binding protein
MRTIRAVTAAFVVALTGVGLVTIAHAQKQTPVSATQVVTLKVPDMFCGGCEVGVKVAATKVDGVKGVKTDSGKRIAEVTFDPAKTTPEAIASAITKNSGFKVEVPKTTKK